MTAELIDGKKLAADVRERLKMEIAAGQGEDLPVLAVVMSATSRKPPLKSEWSARYMNLPKVSANGR